MTETRDIGVISQTPNGRAPDRPEDWPFPAPPLVAEPPSSGFAGRAARAMTSLRGGIVFWLLGAASLLAWIVAVRNLREAGQVSSGWGSIEASGLWWPLSAMLALCLVGHEVSARRVRPARMWIALAILALAVFGTQSAGQSAARVPTAWLHAGFTLHIAEQGAVVPNFDARFAWPGFFAFWAYLTRFADLQDLDTILAWAPVAINLVAAALVLVLARRLCVTARGAWFAPALFLIGNWIEQDYFSPQGSSHLLALTVVALTVVVLSPPPPRSITRIDLRALVKDRSAGSRARIRLPRPEVSEAGLGARVAGLLVIGLLIVPAIVVSHQLTPYALALQLAALVVTGYLRNRWLPMITVLCAGFWLVVGAREFTSGHLEQILGGVGQMSSSVASGVLSRVMGDVGQVGIKLGRIGLTLLIVGIAVAGALWRRRRGRPYLDIAVVAASSFALAALQPYGGEVFMRAHLFALPFLAVLGGDACAWAATAIREAARSWSAPRAAVLLAVAALSAAALVTVVRGGNDAYIAYTERQITGLRQIIREAPTGGSVMGLTVYDPLLFGRLDEVRFDSMDEECVLSESTACVRREAPDVLVTTVGEENYGVLQLGAAPGWTARIMASMAGCGYTPVLNESEIKAFRLTDRAALASPQCVTAAAGGAT